MTTSSDYLTEWLHLSLTQEDGIDLWLAHFDHYRVRWQQRQAQQLLREVKRRSLSKRDLALVRYSEGNLYAQIGDWDRAVKSFMQGIDLLEDSEYVEEGIWILNDLGMVLRLQGNDRGAVSAHQQALTLAQEIGETALEVEALEQLGLDAEHQGRTADAAACFEKALSQGRGSGEETETAVRLNHLGRIQWLQGDLAGAQETLQRALAAIREVDQLDPYHTAQIQANLGNVFYEQEDFDAAEAMWQAALRAFHALNVVCDKCGLLNNLGGLALKRDDLDMAQAYIEESCSIANDLGDQRGMVDALTNLGTLMRRRQDWPAAADYVRQALGCHPGLYYQIGLWQDLARSYLLIALGLLKQANQDQISWSSAMKQAVPEIFLAGVYLVRSFWIKLVHSVRQPFSK